MKHIVKTGLKVAYRSTKRIANSNKYGRRAIRVTKQAIVTIANKSEPRELYNLDSFYPTIQQYYFQSKDVLKDDPLISILLPTYNTPETYLRECLDSILVQSYAKWELCIADDNSTNPNIVKIVKEYQAKDDRVKLIERKHNGHISEATNSALSIAKGEFVSLMDHDDLLWPNALYEMVQVIRDDRKVDFVYSDEDKIDGTGKVHSYPFLKPDFSPEFLESCNFITHFSCIRTTVITSVAAFRKGYEGAQDWDLFIRIGEVTDKIVHIPKILYSWRIHEASTASNTDAKPYVYEAQKKLLTDHLTRTNRQGTIETGIITQHRTINYEVDPKTEVTVIIFYSQLEGSTRLTQSLVSVNAGLPLNVMYVSGEPIPDNVRKELSSCAPTLPVIFTVLNQNELKARYSICAARATTEYLIFAEDCVELLSANYAQRFVADCQLPGVGIVGPVLLSESKLTVRSAGIGIGYGSNGYADMLDGMPFDDPHYTRGLYAKSRRNVSAVNGALFVSRASVLRNIKNASTAIKLSKELLDRNYRHIYTPYVQAIYYGSLPTYDKEVVQPKQEDPYLNPNFNHENPRMEVRG
jgi:hypothetical protein